MRSRSLFIALAVILAILSLAHFVVYEGIVIGFLISSPAALLFLRILFCILDVSFVVAALLASRYNSLFTRVLYRISAVWLGSLLYLFLAAMLSILYAAALSPSVIFSVVVFAAAVATGAYGVVHAGDIKIKEISIKLPGLPQSWKGRKAVFVSDLHLGQVRGEAFAERIYRKIQSIGPSIVFIGGDAYDGVKVDEKRIVQPLSKLEAPLGIFFIMGNHEEFGDNSAFIAGIESAGITVLLDRVVDIEGVQIVGVDYRSTTKPERFAEVLGGMNVAASKPSILLKHTPQHLEIAEEKGIGLTLSGHTHKAQAFPFTLLTPSIFKGFDYGLKKLKNMQVYTSSGVGTWGPPLRVGTNSEIVSIIFGD